MAEIRNYRASDLEALYRICLETGDAGKDASQIYRDPKILGHIYAGPYGVLAPDCALVVEDEEGVGGYIIGTSDTHRFEQMLDAEWWPKLQATYPDPDPRPQSWNPDERLRHLIHRPPRTPRRISEPHPAHLHIDLLPRFQGRGIGKRLIDRWLALMREKAARGAHLGVGGANARAVRFYRAYGFAEIEHLPPPLDLYFFGITLG